MIVVQCVRLRHRVPVPFLVRFACSHQKNAYTARIKSKQNPESIACDLHAQFLHVGMLGRLRERIGVWTPSPGPNSSRSFTDASMAPCSFSVRVFHQSRHSSVNSISHAIGVIYPRGFGMSTGPAPPLSFALRPFQR